MGKVTKKSVTKCKGKEFKVLLDRTIVDSFPSRSHQNFKTKELKVLLTQTAISSGSTPSSFSPVSSGSQRKRGSINRHRLLSYRTLRRKNLKKRVAFLRNSQISNTPPLSSSSATITPSRSVIDKRIELIIRIRQIDIENVVTAISETLPLSLLARTLTPPSILSSASANPNSTAPNVPSPIADPAVPAPAAAILPAPQPPRRRHAIIPRRVTNRRAVGTNIADLEALCANPFTCGPMIDMCVHCGANFFRENRKIGPESG